MAERPDTSPVVPGRLAHLGTTVFTTFSALAAQHEAVNLGQGAPSGGPPRGMVAAARDALGQGRDQYPPLAGIPELRRAVVEDRAGRTGVRYDAGQEVLITVGATEAITAAILALAGPGDEVVVLEPAYDSYAAAADLTGARLVTVPLDRTPGGRFVPDPERLAAALTPRTRVLVVNTPHNPSGTVLSLSELTAIADVLDRHPQVTLISDEVYENLVLDGPGHVSPSELPQLRDRTLVVSSAGKTFSATGWKVGWVLGPRELVAAARAAKQFLTFAANAPFQLAVAHALAHEQAWVAALRHSLLARRDLLRNGLVAAGFTPLPAAAGYFLLAAAPSLADGAVAEVAERLPAEAGVVAIPGAAFYRDPAAAGADAALLRFAFCREEAHLLEAMARLARWSPVVCSRTGRSS